MDYKMLNSNEYGEISSKLVKKFNKQLMPVLARLINAAIEDKIFPDVLKIGKIIPLHEDGDSRIMNNFRHLKPHSLRYLKR